MKTDRSATSNPWVRLALMLLSFAPSVVFAAPSKSHTSPSCWVEPRVHSESRDDDHGLDFQRLEKPLPPGSTLSPNGAYAFHLREETTSENGSSRLELTLYNERPYLLAARLPEVRGFEPPRWINEQLIYFRVWWGRIAGTDFIIDVERERTVLQQTFRYGTIAFQQYQQCKTPEWSDSADCTCFPGAPKDWKPRTRGTVVSPDPE